nr:MAG TPA: hypothetical protein [Caudoviricetes sp.]
MHFNLSIYFSIFHFIFQLYILKSVCYYIYRRW